ncbi:MAG TPA: hypothetical protein VJX31_08695 [Casimicrobiaceae bacterium]|nr:hypothetical protein [Casimicrobiaceae bacterium]
MSIDAEGSFVRAKLVRGFPVVLAGAFVVIAGAQLLKGNALEYAASEGLLWAVISATIFTVARAYRLRKGQYCAVCGDVPLAASDDSGQAASSPRP